MVRYLVALLLLVSFVTGQVPPTCATCDRSKASLIGKVTCDAQGRLIAECTAGLIQMKVGGKYYSFNRVTCIEGEWFGTSCGGVAIHLSTVLPESTCPDIDYPEEYLPGSFCKIRRIGIPYIYEHYFAQLPEKDSRGVYSCADKESWRKFRQTDSIDFYYGTMYTRSDMEPSGLVETDFDLTCDLNATTLAYELHYFNGLHRIPVPEGTNQFECIYSKCPQYLTYNKLNARCEASDPSLCGYAFVYNSSSMTFPSAYPLARASTTTIPSNCTHILSSPGCKLTVFGSKLFDATTVKIPLLFEQTSGLWSIYSVEETEANPTFNRPSAVVCESDGTSLNAPKNVASPTPLKYLISHESRYVSIPLENYEVFFDLSESLEPGLSFSFFGSGDGAMSCHFGTFMIGVNSLTKKVFHYHEQQGGSSPIAERNAQIGSQFHVRFVLVDLATVELHLNGRFALRYESADLDFRSLRIMMSSVGFVDKCDVFVPKKCRKGHRFSEKTGDCEWTQAPSTCGRISKVEANGASWKNNWVDMESNRMLAVFGLKASFIDVRQGCVAYAYNDEDSTPKSLNGEPVLHHSRGIYNFPSFESGTCTRPARGLKNLECYCRDYNMNPGHREGEPLEVALDGSSFVFTAYLRETSPMAQYELVGNDGSSPLVLFIGDGKLLVDNRPVQGGCYENFLVSADNFPVKQGDLFECRIRMGPTGFEIRINGVLIMVYAYRNGLGAFGNGGAIYVTKARFVRGLLVQHYRNDREWNEMGGPGDPKYSWVSFGDGAMKFGDYVHINGMAMIPFNVTLEDQDMDQTVYYEFEVDPLQHRIIQRLFTSKGVKTSTASCSIFSGVEFDIVLINKPQSPEIYVNGVLLPPLGENHPQAEQLYWSANIEGQGADVNIYDARAGPLNIASAPAWTPN